MGGRFIIGHLRDERRSIASSESAELSEKTREEFSRGNIIMGGKSERFSTFEMTWGNPILIYKLILQNQNLIF